MRLRFNEVWLCHFFFLFLKVSHCLSVLYFAVLLLRFKNLLFEVRRFLFYCYFCLNSQPKLHELKSCFFSQRLTLFWRYLVLSHRHQSQLLKKCVVFVLVLMFPCHPFTFSWLCENVCVCSLLICVLLAWTLQLRKTPLFIWSCSLVDTSTSSVFLPGLNAVTECQLKGVV